MENSHQFSSIEIFLMIVVLGLIGVVVSPAISEAGNSSDTSILVERLQEMRFNLDVYKAYNENRLPPCDSFEIFMTTDASGQGPYVKKIPFNPFNGLNTVRFDGVPAGVNKAGWRLDTVSGHFQADNDEAYASL